MTSLNERAVLAALSAAVLLAWPMIVRAETGALREDVDGLYCDGDLPSCSAPGATCGGDPAGTCTATSDDVSICVFPGTAICCETVVDCPAGWACREIRPSGGEGPAIATCFGADMCPMAVDPSECFTVPGTASYTASFAAGDCDGDGIPNAPADHCPCEYGPASLDGCPPVAPPDGGTIGPMPDAGATPDGGVPARQDAATTPDGGRTTEPPDSTYRGNGGCVCTTTGDVPHGLDLLFGMAVVVAGVARARRRSR